MWVPNPPPPPPVTSAPNSTTDNGSQGVTHWMCFIVKDNKSFYFVSFGGQPAKFLLGHLPIPIINHIHKIQVINSKLCGSY